MNRLKAIRPLGQSVWLDNLSAGLISTGELKRLVEEDGITGVTSNPAIFYKAISSDSAYQARLAQMALTLSGSSSFEQRYEGLVIPDIQDACDILADLYVQSRGEDGYVSLEVSPHLANDCDGTLAAARRLWQQIDRPNLMIKIPATRAGIEALKVLISEGININITLLFSLPQVEAVWDAYIAGLQIRQARGERLDHIKAVASFFLSRIDSLLDGQLPSPLQGKAAIALAKVAYMRYFSRFHGEEFAALKAEGAKPQYLLWASTGTKNKAYSDVLYVEQLIGQETINTIPDATLDAFRDHGLARATLTGGLDEAQTVLLEIASEGHDLVQLGEILQQQGLTLFVEAFDKLLVLVSA